MAHREMHVRKRLFITDKTVLFTDLLRQRLTHRALRQSILYRKRHHIRGYTGGEVIFRDKDIRIPRLNETR